MLRYRLHPIPACCSFVGGEIMNTQDIAPKLNPLQIEAIISKIVPLVADPADYEFFSGVLYVMAENSSSVEFSIYVAKILKMAALQPDMVTA